MSARSIAWGALLLLAIFPPAHTQQPGDPAAGKRLAAANCGQCHGADSSAPALAAIAAMPATTEASLSAFLQTPHASMPSLIFSGAELNDLIAYILSLGPPAKSPGGSN
jgi:mono/diheme cytochrome c family protein